MLSRRHIRIKVLQSLYAYWTSGEEADRKQVQKNLEWNLHQLYDLYLYLLLFLLELGKFVSKYDSESKAKHIPAAQELHHHSRLYENNIMQALLNSKTLEKKLEWRSIFWDGDNDLLRKVFLDLKNTDTYQEYISSSEEQPFETVEMLKYIVKNYPDQFGLLRQHLEEKFFNWHDDKKIARQMATKTITNLAEDPEEDDFLLPFAPNEEENFQFARDLFNTTLDHSDEIEALIQNKTTQFEPSQLSKIDHIILNLGTSELLYFRNIPPKATLNEYIEIAKNYSSPKSKKFINGVLDNLRKELPKTQKA